MYVGVASTYQASPRSPAHRTVVCCLFAPNNDDCLYTARLHQARERSRGFGVDLQAPLAVPDVPRILRGGLRPIRYVVRDEGAHQERLACERRELHYLLHGKDAVLIVHCALRFGVFAATTHLGDVTVAIAVLCCRGSNCYCHRCVAVAAFRAR